MRGVLTCTATSVLSTLALMGAPAAHALTTEQLRQQSRSEVVSLANYLLEFTLERDAFLAHSSYDGRAQKCRRTTRRRGSCQIQIEELESGYWCSAIAVTRQRGKHLITGHRSVICGEPGTTRAWD